MIITRTPFRISFFGGGTDYPAWYREHGGCVLSSTIDKYCYISCRNWPPFFEHRYRVGYSRIELAHNADEIQHPSVRACLGSIPHDGGLEIMHNADLPSRTGLGSSSTFTVGLLNALHGLLGRPLSKRQLADQALHIEQDVIGEHVGSQDQVAAAFGGFNHITFGGGSDYAVRPVHLGRERLLELQDHLLLYYSGISRYATAVAEQKIRNIPQNTATLERMAAFVPEALAILLSGTDINDFGRLLHENWRLKRSLASCVSNVRLDGMYEAAMQAGATGGKVLGAGGGGFFLIFARPQHHDAIERALGAYLRVPFAFETHGSQCIFSSPEDSYDTTPSSTREHVPDEPACAAIEGTDQRADPAEEGR